MWSYIKPAALFCSSAGWWMLDRLHGDSIFEWMRPMIPDIIANPALSELITWAPPAAMVGAALYLLWLGARRQGGITAHWVDRGWWGLPRARKKKTSSSEAAPEQEVGLKLNAVMFLANEPEYIHRKIFEDSASHVIRGKVTTDKRLTGARPRLLRVSRWQDNAWHVLNANHRMELGWAGNWEKAYKEQDFTEELYFVLFNYHENEGRLEIVSEANLPSFTDSRNLPLGRYRFDIKVDYEGGVACRGAFVVDWYGKIETMHIEKQMRD